MEIHSSSLNGIHTAYHSKNTDKKTLASNKETGESNQKSTTLFLAPFDPVEKVSNITNIEHLTETIEKQNKILTKSGATHALKAYAEESVQQLKSQRSELISRIDFFT